MKQIFFRELKANFKSFLLWTVITAVIIVVGYIEYSGMKEAGETVAAVFGMMPRIAKIMFGMDDRAPLDTPLGYYMVMYLWITFITFAYSAMLGADLIAKEERDKTSDFLYVKPVTRTQALTGKFLAGIFYCTAIALVCVIATVFSFVPMLDIPFTTEVVITHIGMWFSQLVFFAIGFFLASVLHFRRTTLAAIGVLVVMYFLMVFIQMSETYSLNVFCIFQHFYSYDVIQDGLNPLYMALSTVLVVLGYFVSLACYRKRSLHN